MNWKKFWNQQASLNTNPQAQVGRIKSGITLSEQVLDDIVQYIVEKLQLQPDDQLLDLCCGNGLLTHKLSQHCNKTVAIDISHEQIAQAKKLFSSPDIQYFAADVSLPGYYAGAEKFAKINLYFSFQYFDSFTLGKQAIANMLPLLGDGGVILIGDVPDRKYLPRYYKKGKDRLRYHIKQLLGTNDMGKFWSEREMQRIANYLGLELEVLEQPDFLPYADYRRDFLFKKK
jgi:SAM-dependent methyltransferase